MEHAGRPFGPGGPPPAPLPSRIGPYRILAKLGAGGMGAVYKAHDPMSDRIVALKVLAPGLARNLEFLGRFAREARAAGALNHPNVVAAYQAGEADGFHFLAMEYVDGESLTARLKRRGGRLPEREALAIARCLASGLGQAHSVGLVHRDVKPDNVLVGRNGVVKLTDLGLAKNLIQDQTLTTTGMTVGTPYYISPEQAQGDANLDYRTDIYSLGATLFLLLTGRLPFEGRSNAEIITKRLTEEPPDPRIYAPEISPYTAAVVLRMLARLPADRYRDCGELYDDLDALLSGRAPLRAVLPGKAAKPSPKGSGARAAAPRVGPGGSGPRKSPSGCLKRLFLLAVPVLLWLLR